ncbi:MAG: cytochrome c [Ghiorsea sp.]
MLKKYQHYICTSIALLGLTSAANSAEIVPTENLTETTPIANAQPVVSMEKGKLLFNSICIHCHRTTYEESPIGAPGLQGVLERHDEAWLNQWIKGPEVFAETNVPARDLIDGNRFGLAMPTLAAMQDEHNRLAVIEYLKTLK